MIKAICFLCIVCCFISCKNNDIPKGVLPKDKMEAVLWDYVSADLYVKNILSKDSANNMKDAAYRMQEKVFALHLIDRKTFTKSYNWYEGHDAVFIPMLDSIAAKQARNVEKERNADRNRNKKNIE